MTKVILFDLDGLVIKKKTKLFSERASEELGFPYEQVSGFFASEFRLCSFGKADLKEKIKPHLIKWGYKGSVDDFIKYWFEKESEINTEVVEIIDQLRLKEIRCYIATRQEKYRKQYLLDVLGLKDHFDGIFCTCDIGFDKWEKGYWDFVFKDLKVEPSEIMFFCDSEKNVESAEKLGIKAYFYKGIETFISHLHI